MDLTFQEILAGLIVLAAAIYAGLKTVKQFKVDDREAGCGKCGCAGASVPKTQNQKPFKVPAHFTGANRK